MMKVMVLAVALFAAAPPNVPPARRITVVDAHHVHGHDLFIVRDEETRHEYLIACGGDEKSGCSIATIR